MLENKNPPPPVEWQTFAESSEYQRTPSYDYTIVYCKRLAAASPLLQFHTFGRSGQGRELPLIVATEHNDFSPEAARFKGKPVVLIQACIHAGEPDGKDAGLALLRDIAVTGTQSGLLKNLVLLFIPIYNTDGHERSSPYNRINQNGPMEMGWRTTSTYQNLNRDYMKADTPETRAWLSLWNQWHPDLFVDCHVTDGADFRYNITYHYQHHAGVHPEIVAWERAVIDGQVAPATEAAGNVVSWYLEFKDNRDLTLGMRDFNGSPRFSTGYTPLRNRPGVLIETHMLKDYRSRVIGTYDFLRFTLEAVNKDPQRLLKVVRKADEETIQEQYTDDSRHSIPLDYELTDESTPFHLKAVEYQTEQSTVSGDLRVIFAGEPLDLTVPMYNMFRVKASVVPPVCYVVPREWQSVIDVLKAHGIRLQSLAESEVIDIESYRFHDVVWPDGPFEGRHMPSFTVETIREQWTFAAGSVLVPVAQSAAKVIVNLLEPQAPDSLVKWGFFNAIFEEKEYGESYLLEQLAREMMATDKRLADEYKQLLAGDPGFEASPRARLEFFYKRSPYWDPQMNRYPVGRITSRLNITTKLL